MSRAARSAVQSTWNISRKVHIMGSEIAAGIALFLIVGSFTLPIILIALGKDPMRRFTR